MKSSKLTTHALAAMAIAASAFVSQAQAAAVITIVPSAPTLNVGDPLGVDIFVSGLTQALGGFAFNVNFDGTRLALGLPAFVADPDTKMGNAANPAFDASLGPLGASVNFNVLAGFFLPVDEATLFAIQGNGATFRLGRLDLSATSPGFASIGLSGFSLSNYDGSTTIQSTAQGARVCVGGICADNQIPEPTTPLLVAVALGAMAVIRKKKAA